jgi:(p)ppGpp synthase/HD superfamily hydrolase
MGELTGREKFLNQLRPFMLKRELKQVATAYLFAEDGHRGQERDAGGRYFEYLKGTAKILIENLDLVHDWKIIVAALLHDILEGSWLFDEHRLEVNFGRTVAYWVKLLTKDPKNPKGLYIERLKKHAPWQVLLIKLCDRLHNLQAIEGCDIDKQQKQIDETQEHYYDLCDILIVKIPEDQAWRATLLAKDIRMLCDSHNKRLDSVLDR